MSEAADCVADLADGDETKDLAEAPLRKKLSDDEDQCCARETAPGILLVGLRSFCSILDIWRKSVTASHQSTRQRTGDFIPFIAAAIVLYQQSGFAGVKELLKKAWDYRRIKNAIWYLPALLLAPLIYVFSFALMRLTGLPLPDPTKIPLLMVPAFFVMFLIGDAGEELGWSGYAIDPLQNRWGALRASFILGVVWAVWHGVAFVQTHHSASWILWQSIKTVAMRMVIVWIYNNTEKSVLAANLYHTTDNVSWSLFPNYGSHYNPRVTGMLTWLVVVLIIFGWGAKSLARYRHARASRV